MAAAIIGLGITLYTFTGALSTFGGTFLLVWLGFALGRPRQEPAIEPVTPFRQAAWLIAGGAAAAVYLFWFGGGLIR